MSELSWYRQRHPNSTDISRNGSTDTIYLSRMSRRRRENKRLIIFLDFSVFVCASVFKGICRLQGRDASRPTQAWGDSGLCQQTQYFFEHAQTVAKVLFSTQHCSCKVRGVARCNAFVHFFPIKASRLLQRAYVRSRCYGNIARQVAERVLHDATLKKIVAIVAESRTQFCFVYNDWCNLSRNDFDHCTACYTVQWFVQLVSQRRCETSCMKNCTV